MLLKHEHPRIVVRENPMEEFPIVPQTRASWLLRPQKKKHDDARRRNELAVFLSVCRSTAAFFLLSAPAVILPHSCEMNRNAPRVGYHAIIVPVWFGIPFKPGKREPN
jgi:hypothetical protein